MWYVRNLIAKVHRLFLLTPVSQNILKCSSHSGWSGADFAKLRMALKNFEEFEEVKKWLSAVKERSKGSYLSGFRLYVEFSGKNPKELIDEIEGDREKPMRERGGNLNRKLSMTPKTIKKLIDHAPTLRNKAIILFMFQGGFDVSTLSSIIVPFERILQDTPAGFLNQLKKRLEEPYTYLKMEEKI